KALGVDQLAAAMKDFTASPAYSAFVRQRSTSDRKQFAERLLSAARDLQAYAGVPIGSLAIALPDSPATACASVRSAAPAKRARRRDGAPSGWDPDPLGARLGQAAADYLTWWSQTDAEAASAATSPCSSAIDQQLVAAILSRMIALTSGDAAAQRQVVWEVRHGHDLVPLLVQRLRVFESARDRFVTLGSAYPLLVAGLSIMPVNAPAVPIAQSAAPAGQPDPLAPLADATAKAGS
ncbi:hypothetical protein, partial [Sphingomonas sp.]|uniref:hypothetical protein n=1 Tax=Sphingomonas sp. TaxID=28214 RepID=UPI0025F28F9E